METIATSDYAGSVADKCNTNFGTQIVSADDYAATFVDELNGGFSGTTGAQSLSASDYAGSLVDKLNNNFGLYEQGDVPSGEHKIFRFIHVSDSHSSQYSVLHAKNLMDADETISYLIHTGDIFSNILSSSSNDALRSRMSEINSSGKFLAVPGNHDIAQAYKGEPSYFRHGITIDGTSYDGMDAYMSNSGVTWGSENGCYWHKDIYNVDGNGHKLRIIGICDFQRTVSSTLTNSSINVYLSQAQAEWFADLLKGLSASDYFIVVSHYPPMRDNNASSDGYLRKTHFDKDLFLTDRFVNGAATWLTGHSITQMLVDSYLNKKNNQVRQTATSTWGTFSGTNFDGIGFGGNTHYDFSSCTPAKFLFFMNGHIHADVTYYLNDFPLMLNLNIDTSHSGDTQNWAYDLSRSDSDNKINISGLSDKYWVVLNKVTIDFMAQTINIERIGANKTMVTDNDAYGLNESRTRNTITFPFVRTNY